MLSRSGLANLRRAATLNHLFPTLCTRLSVGQRIVLEVSWSPAPPYPDRLAIHPCAFRTRVAQAWGYCRDGGKLQLLDLAADPAVDIIPVVGGFQWPSGVVRVPGTARHSYLISSTLEPEEFRDRARPSMELIADVPGVIGIGIRGDGETQVTVMHVDTDATEGFAEEPRLVDRLEDLTAVLATAELLSDLARC